MKKETLELLIEKLRSLIHKELKLFLEAKGDQVARENHKRNIIAYLDMVKNYE